MLQTINTVANTDGSDDLGTPDVGTISYSLGRDGRNAMTAEALWQNKSIGSYNFPRQNMSFSAWLKFDSTPVTNQYLFAFANDSLGQMGPTIIQGTDLWLTPGEYGTNSHIVTQNFITLGQWQMHTYTYDLAGDVKYYVDGALVHSYTPASGGTGGATQIDTPSTFYCGFGSGGSFHIQDLIVYDGVISDADAVSLYNSPWTP